MNSTECLEWKMIFILYVKCCILIVKDLLLLLLYTSLVLAVAQERECGGDLLLADMGEGLGFKPGSFDGAIRYILY